MVIALCGASLCAVAQDPTVVPALTDETIAPDIAPTVPFNAEGFSDSEKSAEAIALGQSALERITAAYRAAKAIRNETTYSVLTPDGAAQTDSFIIEIDGKNARVSNSSYNVTALDGTMYLTLADITDKYMATTFTGTVADAIQEYELPLPVADLGLRFDTDPLSAFQFMILTDPKIAGYRNGELLIAAAEGDLSVKLDPSTNLLASAKLVFTPPGVPSVIRIAVDFTMKTTAVDTLPTPIAFDAGARAKVASIEELTGQTPQLNAGTVAPSFTLNDLDGNSVDSASLAGKIVVLDFWATWCGPCRKGLPFINEFAAWAATNAPNVKVFAVNTWEQGDDVLGKVKKFWAEQKFTFPTLLDDGSYIKQYGFQGIPATVVIGADGVVLEVHVGMSPTIVDDLKKLVAEQAALKG